TGWKTEKRFLKITFFKFCFFANRKLTMQKTLHSYLPNFCICSYRLQPHYFIVIAINNDEIFLLKCTSQKEKKEKHFDRHRLDLSGLIFIKPDEINCLTEETFVNCNDYLLISKQILISKNKIGLLHYCGSISLNHYVQIKTGIENSYTSDLPKYLLIDPEVFLETI
ncbi:MAG: hypothetical protein NTW49_10230, partial [Bacteroidia bacterium]|nr:hypothetical protein [Bacteroidia bacterium]